jgi:hypothetical protein
MKMRRRKHNASRIREKHCYTVEEVADLLNTHKNTVRLWMKQGLRRIDDTKPYLIHGLDLKAFLTKRQQSAKQPCKAGEIYCFRCRCPRKPWEGIVDVTFLNQKTAQLTGICSVCEGKLNRRTSITKMDEHYKTFHIQQLVDSRIIASLPPSPHCYLLKENRT